MTERQHHPLTETIPFTDERVRRAVAFIWHEATLLDDRRYRDWEALWADDGRYVIPIDPDAEDFDAVLNMVNDDARMRRLRVDRLTGGSSVSAVAAPRTVRTLSRFTVVEVADTEVELRSAMVLVGSKRDELVHYAADVTHRIRFEADHPLIVKKVVRLVNSDGAVDATGFLL